MSEVNICIRCITYREGVKGLYHSRNFSIARLLTEKGLRVGVYDELLSEDEIEELGLAYRDSEEADLVFDCFGLGFSGRELAVQRR